jgi:hypothetical protein
VSPTANRILVAVCAILGVLLIVVAIVYWIEPAHSLPGFFPGHEAGSSHHHVKHGIAALVVGLAVLGAGWFASARAQRQTVAHGKAC